MDDMDYFQLYNRVSPAVDRYLSNNMMYAGQNLGSEQIDIMAENIYSDIIREYPDMKEDNVGTSQRRRRGFLRPLIAFLLLERLFRRHPFFPGFGFGAMPGFGPF